MGYHEATKNINRGNKSEIDHYYDENIFKIILFTIKGFYWTRIVSKDFKKVFTECVEWTIEVKVVDHGWC